MALKLITPPASEPVGLSEAKTHLRVWDDAEDQYLSTLIKASRRWCETYLRRSLITTRWRQTFGCLPRSGVIELAKPPVTRLESFQYVDSDGVTQTMPEATYEADFDSEPGRLLLAHEQSWPTLRTSGVAAPVTITFDAGYGATPADVPETIRHAMLFVMGHWYENRANVVIGSAVYRVPKTAESLLATESWGDYP